MSEQYLYEKSKVGVGHGRFQTRERERSGVVFRDIGIVMGVTIDILPVLKVSRLYQIVLVER
jgi:hypothetical protein